MKCGKQSRDDTHAHSTPLIAIVKISSMTRASATLDLAGHDEHAHTAGSEVIVTIRLKLGAGLASRTVSQGPGHKLPELAHLADLLQLLATDDATTTFVTEIMPGQRVEHDDPLLITVFPASRTVLRGSEEIALTRREFDLLLCLAENPLRVFTRAQLLAKVWDNDYTGQRSVDVHVLRLRAKIGMDVPLVLTLRGVGYRLHNDARVQVVREP